MINNRVHEEAMRVLRDRLSPLVPYMEDDGVNEIMINAPGHYFVEKRGVMEKLDIELPQLAIDTAIRAVMAINDKDTTHIMDARMPGLRVACALPPVAVHGPMMVIRKHARQLITLSDYVQAGAFNRDASAIPPSVRQEEAQKYEALAAQGGECLAEFLVWAVRSKKNLLVAGGTSSGKTTLLSSLLNEIPRGERIITCEDTNEIHLVHPNIVQYEAYSAPGIVAPITIRDLIRLCLRSRPDRIVVGEIRGAEAYDFLDALNTGHGGSLCTLHADGAFLALRRLESLIRMSPTAANLPLPDMRAAIASAIDYVIYQSRHNGVRAPEQIIALEGVNSDGDYHWRGVYSRFPGGFAQAG